MKVATLTNAQLAIEVAKLVKLQMEKGVSTHQLARNEFSMKRMILAAFVLYNPKKVLFPGVGLTCNEIFNIIQSMHARITFPQLNMELQNLKKAKKVEGGYCEGSGKAYVWSVL